MQLINLVWFQLGWWGLVLSASSQRLFLCIGMIPVFIGFHFYFVSQNRKRDLTLLALGGFLGLTGEWLLWLGGFLDFFPRDGLFPYWIVGLWMLFPLTFPYSFHAFFKSPIWMLVTALLASLSYQVGPRFGILGISEPQWVSHLALFVDWFILLLLFQRLFFKDPRLFK